MLETVRLSEQAKDQLVTLKRRTGIGNWNILCRWAFCRSLAEPTTPPKYELILDSNIEMGWRTFAGDAGNLYWALLEEWCSQRGILDEDDLREMFKLHLHRGIGYLVGDSSLKSIENLVHLASRGYPESGSVSSF